MTPRTIPTTGFGGTCPEATYGPDPAKRPPWTAGGDTHMAFYLTDDAANVVPEPTSLLLIGLGGGFVALRRRRGA